MPCYDAQAEDEDRRIHNELQRKLRKTEAMLCMVLHATECLTLSDYDEKQSGVTIAELEEWWKEHEKLDMQYKGK
jgi:hypothetical protein